MRILRYALHVLLFFAVGEVVVRVDQATAFFRSGERLANEPKPSGLLTEVEGGHFQTRQDELRVMVVGDSYLFGAGVPPADVFAHRLEEELKQGRPPDVSGVRVLDVTRPGNNTFANLQDYQSHTAFQPHVVILAYNANDVYGQQRARTNEPVAGAPAAPSGPTGASPAVAVPAPTTDASLDLVSSVRRLVFTSQLLQHVIQTVNMELKVAGVVVPGTEFEHMVHRSHTAAFSAWSESQAHLRTLVADAEARGARVIVANVPELNMLARPDLFAAMNREIARFFRGLGHTEFLELTDAFVGAPGNYAISRYDGHPNAAAHALIAHNVAMRVMTRRP